MRLLFTGRGGNGSWAMRGEQLGDACGAVVKPHASAKDIEDCDVAVVVKRVPHKVLADLRDSGKPWIFDTVDFYPQPQCAAWSAQQSIDWVRDQIAELNPTGVIWATERMREDCSDGRPCAVVKHHGRASAPHNPIRDRIATIGYEGRPDYLADWRFHLTRECEKRGYRFVENPKHLADLDVVVAFRGGQWDSYSTRHWKSGVKLANAHATGTPFIGQPSSAYLESATGCEYWASKPKDIGVALDWLEAQSTREQVSDRFRLTAYKVRSAAAEVIALAESL